MEMSCSVGEKSSAALFGASSGNQNSKIWTGLHRCANKEAPSSPQFNSSRRESKTLESESMFESRNELLCG
jgi:hypothetical protein